MRGWRSLTVGDIVMAPDGEGGWVRTRIERVPRRYVDETGSFGASTFGGTPRSWVLLPGSMELQPVACADLRWPGTVEVD